MKKFGLCLLILICFSSMALAKELKIGVVDIQRVVKESKAGQKAMAKLQAKFQELKTQLQQKEEELKKFKADIEKKAPLLSSEAQQEKERQYQKMLREYQTQREDAQYEMRQAEQKALQPILKDLEKVVQKMAEEEHFDLILEKKMPGLYWLAPKLDITNHVIELYDQYLQKKH